MENHYLVTGASRGIGFELVKSLAEQNHSITIAARTESRLSSLSELFPGQIQPIPADITTKEGRSTLLNHFKKEKLMLNGIVHNAGFLVNKPFDELTLDDWQSQLDVNLLAPVMLTKQLLPYLNTGSHIVNIGSMGGFQGSSKFPGLAGYSVAKGALSILSECLAVELADRNISCNCLCLGAVQTEMLESAFPGIEAPVEPGEMAHFICNFLLTAHNFINGKVLPITLADPA